MKLLLKMIGRIAAILDYLAWKLKDLEHRFYNAPDWIMKPSEFHRAKLKAWENMALWNSQREERQYSDCDQ